MEMMREFESGGRLPDVSMSVHSWLSDVQLMEMMREFGSGGCLPDVSMSVSWLNEVQLVEKLCTTKNVSIVL